MNTFEILKQKDKIHGCIPACAASVLNHLGIPKPDWSELGLMAMYYSPPSTPPLSGFNSLKQFLDAQPEMKGWEVVIQQGVSSALKNLITGVVNQHGPALIHINGNSAHCVVIVEPDENGAIICDPDSADQTHITWADVESGKIKFGELLYFQKAQR